MKKPESPPPEVHDLERIDVRPRDATDPETVPATHWHRFRCSCGRIGRWVSSSDIASGAHVVHASLCREPAPWRDHADDVGPRAR